LVGSSAYSAIGSGGEITNEPNSPDSLMNNVGVSTKDQIGLTWYAGSDTGGRDIDNYRLWYIDGLSGDWLVVADTITLNYYTFPTTMGNWYTFKVQARNSVGYGTFSSEI
jgi:hypothetical protein